MLRPANAAGRHLHGGTVRRYGDSITDSY